MRDDNKNILQNMLTVSQGLQVFLISTIVISGLLIWIIIKYDPFLFFNKPKDVLSIDSMSTWMEQSGYMVAHPDTSQIKIAKDGIVIYKTSYAQAEYFEFEDDIDAKSCYMTMINRITEKYENDESLQLDIEENCSGIVVGSSYYYLKIKGNHILYVWTEKGFVDSVNELITDIPF